MPRIEVDLVIIECYAVLHFNMNHFFLKNYVMAQTMKMIGELINSFRFVYVYQGAL
jgi:hypothetical protein